MTSRIKHLQLAKLHPSTRVANSKSMTPNQLRFRASGFKGFRHIPLGPCSGFKAKRHGFYSSFSSFIFIFAFSFLFHLEDYIGLHSRVTQTYYESSTDLRLALQSGFGSVWEGNLPLSCTSSRLLILVIEYCRLSIF